MSNDYYTRPGSTNTDGTPLFATDIDKENEDEVVAQLEKAWNCQIKPFGKLCSVDFYAIRDGRIVGVLELKSRTHDSTKYNTVFLNFRKWLALKLASIGLGCPSIFVVKFTDTVCFIPVDTIPVGKVSIAGTKKLVKSSTDIEPVFEVPINIMKRLL